MIRKHLLIFTFASLILFSCNDRAEKEIYVLPKGFIGRVVIFYNQIQGSPIRYKNKHRMYFIPDNGLFTTQFGINDGFHAFNGDDEVFCTDDGNGIYTNLPVRYEEGAPGTPHDTVVQVFRRSDGSRGSVHYTEFFVDKFVNLNKYFSGTGFDQLKEWEEMEKKAGVK
jgi:hypothetical protein